MCGFDFVVLAEEFVDTLVVFVNDTDTVEETFGLGLIEPDADADADAFLVARETVVEVVVVVVFGETDADALVVVEELVLASTLLPVISIKVKKDITKAVAIRSDAPWTRILSVCL